MPIDMAPQTNTSPLASPVIGELCIAADWVGHQPVLRDRLLGVSGR